MTEDLSYRIKIDTQEIDQQQMRMQMMAQQQASMIGSYSNSMNPQYGYGGSMIAQQQAMMMASQSAMGMGSMSGLDPRSVFAEEAYMSSMKRMSPMESNMVGLYGEPIMSPRYYTGSEYQYPRGFIPGAPEFPENNIRSFAANMGNYGMTLGANIMGFKGLGVGAPLDDPIYRQIQSMTEAPARQMVNAGLGAAQMLGNGAFMGASLMSSFKLPFMMASPLNFGLMAGQRVMSDSFKGVNDYIDTGEYFRDAMAPYIRSSRLGGGPNGHQLSDFTRKLSGMAASDERFTRDDYQNILKLGVEQGFMQTSNDVEKAGKVVENLGKNLRSMYELSIKVKDTQQIIQQASSLGINMATGTNSAQSFLGLTSLAAFQSGQTVSQMMPGLVQAGSLFAQQGLAPSLGGQLHAMAQGVTGEAIRGGAFSFEDLAYFGGKQGISESLTRVYANMNRSTLGNLMGLSMANNPELASKMGNISNGQLLNEMSGFSSPDKYFELQYRMPELSRNISDKNPSAFGSGMMKNIIRMMAHSMGQEKIGVGELYSMMMNPSLMGLTPQDARAQLKIIEGADTAYKGAQDSIINKSRQVQLEAFRSTANIWSESGRKNLMEKFIEKPIGDFAAYAQEKMYGISDWMEEGIFHVVTGGEVIKVNPQTGRGFTDRFMRGMRGENIESKDIQRELDDINKRRVDSASDDSVIKSVQRRLEKELKEQINSNREFLQGGLEQRLNRGSAISSKIDKSEIDEILKNATNKNNVSNDDLVKLREYIMSQGTNKSATDETNRIVNAINNIKITPDKIIDESKKTNEERGEFIYGFNNGSLNDLGKSYTADLKIKGQDQKFVNDLFYNNITNDNKMKDPLLFQKRLKDQLAMSLEGTTFDKLSEEKKRMISEQAPLIIRDFMSTNHNKSQQEAFKDFQVKMKEKVGSSEEELREDYEKKLKGQVDFSYSFNKITDKDSNKESAAFIDSSVSGIEKGIIDSYLNKGNKINQLDKDNLNTLINSGDLGNDSSGVSYKYKLSLAKSPEEYNNILKSLSSNLEKRITKSKESLSSDEYKSVEQLMSNFKDGKISYDNISLNKIFKGRNSFVNSKRSLQELDYMVSEDITQGLMDKLELGQLGLSEGINGWFSGSNDVKNILTNKSTKTKSGMSELFNQLSDSSNADIKELSKLGKNILDNDIFSSNSSGKKKQQALEVIKAKIKKFSEGTISDTQLNEIEGKIQSGNSMDASTEILRAINDYSGKQGGAVVTGGDTTMAYQSAKSMEGVMAGFTKEIAELKNLVDIKSMLKDSGIKPEFFDNTDKNIKAIADESKKTRESIETLKGVLLQRNTLGK